MADVVLSIKTVMENSDVISNINQIQNKLESLKMPKDLTDKTKAKFEELTGLVKEYQTLMDKPHKSNADLRRLDQLNVQMKKIEAETEKMIRGFDFSKLDFSEIDSSEIQKLKSELDEVHKKLQQITKNKLNSSDIFKGGKPTGQFAKMMELVEGSRSKKTKNLFGQMFEGINTGKLDQVQSALKELDRYLKPGAFSGATEISNMWKDMGDAKGISTILHDIINDLQTADGEFRQTANSAEELENAITRELVNRMSEMENETEQVAKGFRDASDSAEAYRNSVTHAANQQSEMQQQVQMLQQQVKNYFGLDEIFRKIGDLARSAMDTVKELDAAMTETAVVTNFDVSDMWNMLPTYTKNANQLGSTIADVYNAATLYYQQGLTTTQSMALANETLKMARIGGIEAAEATDMMTAALRGFNMEINQTSAQRINDVYSKLAAITAADTKEIGTAMERTASIAHSANMDFETTSAFLSQMIETTREAPENLGTAMKTIVARFQEMKVDPNSLVDSEGERLDFNRVDKALKSVGISLVNENNEFRKLDDVFLEIASRWDGMTQAQQRYVATIAAGSRQQSRFIAMMQDYDRTIELVDAAYTSAGAGQAQFEKTLESMDSKLNRLKNAWDQFAMGFMNADFLKVGVDFGTKFLDVFEKVITAFSKIGVIDPFQSIIKSGLTLVSVFGGLLAFSKLLMAGIGKFAGMVLGEEAQKIQGFTGAAARQANNPERQAKITQAKEEAKQVSKAYNDTYIAEIGKGSSKIEAIRAAKQAQVAEKQNIKQANIKSSFFKDVVTPFHEAVQASDLDKEGQEAAYKFSKGIIDRFHNGEDAQKLSQELAKGFEFKGQKIKFDIPGIQVPTEGMGAVSAKFDQIGTSARNAGASIQNFAMTLYGTPLQPVGMALNLVGNGLQGIGQLAQGASNGLQKLAQASTSVAMATELANGTTVQSTVEAYANATGQTVDAAATELASMAHDKAAIAAKAESAGLNQNTIANLKNAASHLANAKSMKGMARNLGTKMFGLLGKLPVQIGLAVAGVAALGGAIYMIATKGERALKRQGDAASQAGQDLDTAKQALQAVTNDLEELGNNDNALDNLIKGTAEWNVQLAEANAHIIEMMGHYKTLNDTNENGEYKYVTFDKDGRMSITQAGQDAIQKEYQNAVNMAAANNAVQGALYNNMKDLNAKQFKDNAALIRQANQTGVWSDEAKTAKLENENIIKQNDARLENAWKVGIHSALADAGLVNSDAVEAVLTGQRDQMVDAVQLGSRKENEERYAELMGYIRTGKGEYKDAQGNALTIDYKTVKEMLPEMEGLATAQEKATEVQSALTAAQSKMNSALEGGEKRDNYGIISDILGKNADTNSDALRDFISKEEGKSNLDTFIDTFSSYYDEQDAKILSALTGMDVDASNYAKALDTLEDTLEQNANDMIEQQENAISGIAGILSSINWGGYDDFKKSGSASEAAIKDLINSMTNAQVESLSRVAEGMSDNFGVGMAQDYAHTIATMFASGEAEAKAGAEELQNIMNNVDFTSSLATIEAFHKAATSNNDDVKEYGKNWLETGDAARATANALQEVYTSDDMAELSEDMATYIDEQGQLDATKILEMAESSQSLNRYLQATGASAEGVARAFTLIGQGEIAFSDLTPGVVAAANAMDQLSASTGRANRALENFEIKNDSGKYQDALTGNRDSLQEMADAGEWGNAAFQEVLSKIFGPEAWASAYEQGKSGISDLFNQYKSLTDNGAKKVGEIADKLGDNLSFEELRKGIKESDWGKDLTDEAVDILINSATNTNVDLQRKLRAGNPAEMRKEYIKATGLDQGGFGTSKDIANQARLFSSDVEKQRGYIKDLAKDLLPEDAFKDFETKLNAAGDDTDAMALALANASDKIIKFDSSMTGEEIAGRIQSDWRKAQGEDFTAGDKWWKQDWAKNEQGGYDIQAIISALERAGVDSTQALDTAREIALQNKDQEFTAGGEKLEEADLADLNSFADRIQESLDKEQWVQVGQTIGEQIVEAWKHRNDKEPSEKTYKDLTKDQQKIYRDRNTADALAKDKGVSGWNRSAINQSGEFKNLDNLLNTFKGIASSFTGEQRSFMAGQYLQKNTDELVGKDSETIANSIQEAAKEMDAAGMNAKEIADAINQGYGTNLTKKDIEGVGDGKAGNTKVNLDKQNLEEQIANLHADIKATIEITGVKGLASGQNNHRFGTFARGSRGGYTIPGRPTLTGEEGEELVWEPKQNRAYMVGSNGPQFANISRDAVVWNAEQTKKIKKNSSIGSFGTGARGITPFGTMAKAAGPGGHRGGGAGNKLSLGPITIPATANIEKVEPYTGKPVPVKAKLDVEGAEKGGFINKIKGLFGKGDKGPTVKVTAEATSVKVTEKGASVKVSGDITKLINKVKKPVTGIKGTATVTKVKKGASVAGEPVTVQAKAKVGSVDSSGAQSAVDNVTSAASSSQTMTVGANTGPAMAKINALISKFNKVYTLKYKASGPSSIKVPISANFIGKWEKTVKIKNGARGQNYQKYNSYAGGHGLIGPKGKGGPTLTGEEGYEVVWLPKQNKSMIVGVKGPQMMNLPANAVVWPHEQSKKILKNNKGMPIGSSARGTVEAGSAKKGVKKRYKYGVTKTESAEAAFFKLIGAIDAAKNSIDHWSKAIDRAKSNMDYYSDRIYSLGTSTALINKHIEKQNNLLEKSLKVAQEELANAKAARKKIDSSQKRVAISYNTNSSKKGKSKEFRVREGNLVTMEDGQLVINEAWIRKTAKKKGKNAYQVNQIIEEMRSQAQSLVDTYQGMVDEAQDAIQDVKDQQRELRKTIVDLYYAWEVELSELKNLQDKMKLGESYDSVIEGAKSLLEAQLKANYNVGSEAVQAYRDFVDRQIATLNSRISQQQSSIQLMATQFNSDISASDEFAELQRARRELSSLTEGTADYIKKQAEIDYWEQQYNASNLARQYVTTEKDEYGNWVVNFDYDKFQSARGQMTETQAEAVQDYYEKLLSDIQEMNDTMNNMYDNIASIYQQITDTYSEMDGYAKTVVQGMQSSEESTIDSLQTLNDTLKDAFSDLIDSVRKELDRQRKLEENAKTEKDITDQMNRLAMLRADTSGSNAAEIAKLEKEIAEATGNYEDSLEDQLLERLQDDADKAAEQRERQISILQDQLEYTKAIGQYITKAENLIQKVINGTATTEELAELKNWYMLGTNGKDPLTVWGKKIAEGEWNSAITHIKNFTQTIEEATKHLKEYEDARIGAETAMGNTTNITGQLDGMDTEEREQLLKNLREENMGPSSLMSALFDAGLVSNAGEAIAMLKNAGYTADQFEGATWNGEAIKAQDMLQGGYTYNDIKDMYSAKDLLETAKETETVNTSNPDVGGGSTLSGTTQMVKNNKGVDVTGVFDEQGRIAFKQGAAVYYKDPETNKVVEKKGLSKFTENDFNTDTAAWQEYTEATLYALKHNKVGKKVKNLKNALAWAINSGAWSKKGYDKGQDLKGIKAKGSVGAGGNVYYNSKDRVKRWDPETGKIKTFKYNKKQFAEDMNKAYIGREYSQAREWHKKKYGKYLYGGLADYTGPAWMDGTKSKPELVLNATDTKNFIALKDVLSEATKRGAFSHNESTEGGDMAFDININVDKLESDYDVDQVADRVKKIIIKEAKYRNVTVTGRSR